jgi:hypothetical protein
MNAKRIADMKAANALLQFIIRRVNNAGAGAST